MKHIGIAISEPFLCKGVNAYRGFIPRRVIPMRSEGRDGDGLIFILEGRCRYTFDDGAGFTAQKNDVLYLADGAVYAMDVDCERYEFLVVNFTFADPRPRGSTVYHPRDKEGVKQLFVRLCSKRDVFAPHVTADRLSLFYRLVSVTLEGSDPRYLSGRVRAKVESAAAFIQDECRRSELSVAELAEKAGMSEVYFRRLFVRYFGVSPARYIMRARVDRARELMVDPSLSLADIAELSGFSSPAYFYRVFREITGNTPAAYRRDLLNYPL